MFFTLSQGKTGYLHAVADKRGIPVPFPGTSGKPHISGQFPVVFHHLVIGLFVSGIVIPVEKLYICRNLLLDLLCDMEFFAVVFASGDHFEKHITPHHSGVSVFFTDFQDAVQMAFHNINAFLIAETVQVSATADHLRFIHSDVDGTALKGL